MPLISSALSDSIKGDPNIASMIVKLNETDGGEAAGNLEKLIDAIAFAVDLYIKSGIVNTVVTGASPAGPVTGVGVGSMV